MDGISKCYFRDHVTLRVYAASFADNTADMYALRMLFNTASDQTWHMVREDL